ncbi:ATP-dependent RecD-like DNA helicase [Alkalibacter saccharofermentans]|uniref:ATP-dependent RecD2 DNA helicase n=1 Tax=Alkalibacter saccharofermentans DSM 14828 TaxID=1120975 RepID=A0A1M4VW41_9FIRM|nr:ATP-dependent RecD-like DNA helicase [Alkalibacter saccharofermentans]SHE73244.1 exodeoxyribonuclease V alpha subunit [Alkalibacter saccharofermentans DSM 14828]
MEKLSGYIENVIYHNEQNNFTVMELDCGGNLVTVTGSFPTLNPGEYITVKGAWSEHPSFGVQLKAHSFKVEIPETVAGMEKYLASGLITGIGEKKARLLVERFKEDVLDIIRYNPDRLTEVEGIGKKTASMISESFNEHREVMDIIMFLGEYGISSSMAMRVYKVYRDNTISVIKENPYKLIRDVPGIGFKLADEIAMSMGVEQFSPFRVMAGIKHMLQSCYNDGNMYMEEEELVYKSASVLDISEDLAYDNVEDLVLQGDIKLETIEDKRVYYTIPLFKAEESVAEMTVRISRHRYENEIINVDKIISSYERQNDIELDEAQKNAVKAAVENGVVIITGGPGTGKTTIIKCILEIFQQLDYDIALAAPTGRAAKRMSEATGFEAKTIHRMLEFGYSENEAEQTFDKNEENPLEYDVVIVDEASMIDILLMNHLLKAIRLGTRLILVGDINQLPSVGPGNVLKDIIDSNQVSLVVLNKIFRQAQESMIVVNAHKINNGEMPMVNDKEKDFYFINCNTGEKVRKTILDICTHRLKNYNGYDFFEDIQVVTPMKKGAAGINELNKLLQLNLNPPSPDKEERTFMSTVYREGDKVMQIKNNYNIEWLDLNTQEEGQGVFNGDIGIIKKINQQGKNATVIFDDDKQVIYSFEQMDELILSYAITVHKSQGSEFKVVVMPVFQGPRMLLNRNLLYTAITRGKELVVLVGHRTYLKAMIENINTVMRKTGLRDRIRAHAIMED